MDRRARLLYLIVAGILLVALIVSFDLGVGFEDLWLQILVYLIVAALLFEPLFSGAVSATTNSIAVAVFALSTGFDQLSTWWWVLFALAVTALTVLLFAYGVEEAGLEAGSTLKTSAAEAKRLGRLIGSWRFLLISALLLALTALPASNAEFAAAAIVVGFILVAVQWRPHDALSRILSSTRDRPRIQPLLARPPVEILAREEEASGLAVGSSVLVNAGTRQASGFILSEATVEGRGAWRVFVLDLEDLLQVSPVTDLDITVAPEADPPDGSIQQEIVSGSTPLGVIRERSRVDALLVDLHPENAVAVGQIVWTIEDDVRTYWQTSSAEVRTTGWAGDTRRVVVAECNQLGSWNSENLKFESSTTSPPLTGLVLGADELVVPAGNLPPNTAVVGNLPGSTFPVVVDLRKLSLQHSAILGTTGTGKTHLAFGLLDELSQRGTRVLCYDSTGQYFERFPDAETVTIADVEGYIAEAGGGLAIIEGGTNMITEGNQLARQVFEWARNNEFQADPEGPAPCLIAFEEAQNVIPEAFVINDWDLKARAQDTSQVIMESRKLGIGFMIISQRTAMVTKSALSQCNTLFAFQAVDQTGLDYFEGLCGSAMAKSIPTLQHRTAIAMGTATTSDRPMIFYVNEAEVVVD